MHKKLEAELAALAHGILEIKNKDDVNTLHKKAQLICEKLAVLKFAEAYVNEMPTIEEVKKEVPVEEYIEKTNVSINSPINAEIEEEKLIIEEEKLFDEVVKEVENIVSEAEVPLGDKMNLAVEFIAEENTTSIANRIEKDVQVDESLITDDRQDLSSLQFTLEDEFKDAISADVATELFERATKENPVVEEKAEIKQKSLNDSLFSNKLQVGLNDRIAFVKHLFEGSQEDFNRVLSQLNSFKTEDEAKIFIQEFVKPDYNWSSNLEYEERLMGLIERKFL